MIRLGEKVVVTIPTGSYTGFVVDIRNIKKDIQLPSYHEYKVVNGKGEANWHGEVDVAKTK